MTRQGGLGRGLDALIPAAGPGQSGLTEIRISEIVANRRQPRGDFDPQGLEDLAHSLQQVGMLQPVLVRPLEDGRFELIAGERRTRAARLAGFEQIPAVVRQTDDAALLTEALVENLHRADLNPLEEAAAYQQLLDDFGLTHDELADRIGRSRPAITNALRLLTLPPSLQQRVASGVLRPGHARTLLALQDHDLQERAAKRVVAEGLSVRATEELVRRLMASDEPTSTGGTGRATPRERTGQRGSRPLFHVERQLTDALSTKVELSGDVERGKIVIDYAGREDLERLLGILGRGTGADLMQEQG